MQREREGGQQRTAGPTHYAGCPPTPNRTLGDEPDVFYVSECETFWSNVSFIHPNKSTLLECLVPRVERAHCGQHLSSSDCVWRSIWAKASILLLSRALRKEWNM